MPPKKQTPLKTEFSKDIQWEIGVDEAGRGPLFGRLYVAAAILPKGDSGFDHSQIKDSKRFSSEKKIRQVADYIKQHAVAWSVQYVEADVIDAINIRQAVLKAMRQCCRDVLDRLPNQQKDVLLLIDGNDFPAFTVWDKDTESLAEVPSQTVEGGDNLYTCIAAASILAKVSRDDYILELCKTRTDLSEKYGIDQNKGYGTKKHMDGLLAYGPTEFHRKSYAPVKRSLASTAERSSIISLQTASSIPTEMTN